MSRVYFPHRRAYAPRTWPGAIIAGVVVFVLNRLTGETLVAIPAGVAIGFGFGWIRWALWQRRHPPISAQDILEDRRKAAKWN